MKPAVKRALAALSLFAVFSMGFGFLGGNVGWYITRNSGPALQNVSVTTLGVSYGWVGQVAGDAAGWAIGEAVADTSIELGLAIGAAGGPVGMLIGAGVGAL